MISDNAAKAKAHIEKLEAEKNEASKKYQEELVREQAAFNKSAQAQIAV